MAVLEKVRCTDGTKGDMSSKAETQLQPQAGRL